jgi:hypothetical protein
VPQRLLHTAANTAIPLDVQGRQLLGAHAQVVSILHSRLGRAHGDLLAIPLPDAQGVAWSTALAGEVVPATALPPEERARLDKRAQQMLSDIRSLGVQLAAEGAAAQMVGQMLERAAQTPPGDWLYSVGGKPVLAMWGHSDKAQQAVPAAMTAAAAAAAGPGAVAAAASAPGAAVEPCAAAAATATAASAPPEPAAGPAAGRSVGTSAGSQAVTGSGAPASQQPASRRWQWGLLAVPLLVAAVFALARSCTPLPPVDDTLDRQIADANARNNALEDEIARKKVPVEQFACVRPPPEPEPAASAPAVAASEPQAPVSQAEAPQADPLDALQNRVAAAGKNCKELQALSRDRLLREKHPRAQALQRQVTQALQQNCGERLIQEAKNMCPGQRPVELAPELALVFDASGSMRWSLGVTEQDLRKMSQVEGMMRAFGLGQGVPGLDMSRAQREPTRMTAARQAALNMARRAPSDANIGLVLVEECPSARNAGFYPPARRGALTGILQGVQPRGGTPLADGIAQAGRMVDGVKREALMVVISDGAESCGRDPCAEAAALVRAKPHLKINVVDITGTGAANCVAQIGRGRVFTARNAEEVAAMTRQASQDAMAPAKCKP